MEPDGFRGKGRDGRQIVDHQGCRVHHPTERDGRLRDHSKLNLVLKVLWTQRYGRNQDGEILKESKRESEMWRMVSQQAKKE